MSNKDISGTVMVFATGQIAVFGGPRDEQIPELQEAGVILWAKHAESLGYDPEKFNIEFSNSMRGKFLKTSDGKWNWQIQT